MNNSLIEENAKAWEIVGHRDQEIKKLLEDKIKLLEKIISIYEIRPYFEEAEDIMKKHTQEVK